MSRPRVSRSRPGSAASAHSSTSTAAPLSATLRRSRPAVSGSGSTATTVAPHSAAHSAYAPTLLPTSTKRSPGRSRRRQASISGQSGGLAYTTAEAPHWCNSAHIRDRAPMVARVGRPSRPRTWKETARSTPRSRWPRLAGWVQTCASTPRALVSVSIGSAPSFGSGAVLHLINDRRPARTRRAGRHRTGTGPAPDRHNLAPTRLVLPPAGTPPPVRRAVPFRRRHCEDT
nr:hypothetical protein [Plantactinospora sp. KBS50]